MNDAEVTLYTLCLYMHAVFGLDQNEVDRIGLVNTHACGEGKRVRIGLDFFVRLIRTPCGLQKNQKHKIFWKTSLRHAVPMNLRKSTAKLVVYTMSSSVDSFTANSAEMKCQERRLSSDTS